MLGLGFGVLGFWGLGLKVLGLGFRVLGLGFWVLAYTRSQKVGALLSPCPEGKVHGILALIIRSSCSNFLGFTKGFISGLGETTCRLCAKTKGPSAPPTGI